MRRTLGNDYNKTRFRPVAPALRDIAPDAVKHTKRAMDNYERTRATVLGAHESAERIVHATKRALPELDF